MNTRSVLIAVACLLGSSYSSTAWSTCRYYVPSGSSHTILVGRGELFSGSPDTESWKLCIGSTLVTPSADATNCPDSRDPDFELILSDAGDHVFVACAGDDDGTTDIVKCGITAMAALQDDSSAERKHITVIGGSAADEIGANAAGACTGCTDAQLPERCDYNYMTVEGDGGGDVISLTNSSEPDVVSGGSGDDTIRGWAGADDLEGGSGNDNIDGGTGNDRVVGDTGADTLTGGTGTDCLCGLLCGTTSASDGNDTMNGGDDNDYLCDANTSDVDTFNGGLGYDTYYYTWTWDSWSGLEGSPNSTACSACQ